MSHLIFCCQFVDDITAIAWHPSSRYLATAGGADRQIRVWHNAAGIRIQIDDLQGRMYRAKNENVKVSYIARVQFLNAATRPIPPSPFFTLRF